MQTGTRDQTDAGSSDWVLHICQSQRTQLANEVNLEGNCLSIRNGNLGPGTLRTKQANIDPEMPSLCITRARGSDQVHNRDTLTLTT
jgi:hypothetical protein